MRQSYSAESVCFNHKEKWTKMKNPSLGVEYPINGGGGCYRVFSVGITCLQCIMQNLFNNIKIINKQFVFTPYILHYSLTLYIE